MSVLIQRLSGVYHIDKPDLNGFLAEVRRITHGYSNAEQERAADIIFRTYKYKTFPMPCELIAALIVARDQINPPKFEDRNKTKPGWSKTEIEHADQLIQCDIGRQAAKEGWIRGLHEWIAKNHRFPSQGELSGIKARSMAIKADVEEMLAEGCTPHANQFWTAHQAIIANLTEIAHGNRN